MQGRKVEMEVEIGGDCKEELRAYGRSYKEQNFPP